MRFGGRLLRFNWLMFGAMLALVALGTLTIHSAGHARAEEVFHAMWRSNLVTALVGLLVYLLLAFADYRRYLPLLAWPVYAVSLAMLVAVLFVGDEIYGGRRWLFFFQPSEIAKLAILALTAALLGSPGPRLARLLPRFPGFITLTLLTGVPCLLVLAEPDLGTTLVLVPSVTLMMLVAGVWRRGLVMLLALGALGACALLGAVYEAEKPGVPAERRERILRVLPLRPHQVRRVKVFLFPEEDPLAAGYNLKQAKISIGSGGLGGKGFGKGELNHMKYLPQSVSMNDFIFCVYAEERGFRGSLLLLGLFAALILPCCWIAFRADDERGRLLALGVAALLFAHVYINIAMAIGLVPITGLPLPLISSGRTFLVVVLCALGLVQSVSLHRGKICYNTDPDEET